MHRYEALLLTVPEITADETAALESHFEKTIKEHGGTLLAFDRWGKYYLAYPVRNHEYGIYFLARLEVTSEHLDGLLAALQALCMVRYAELIMRHMVTTLDERKPLEYQRPESLEEAPPRSVGTFLKENKMTGLLKSASVDEKAEDLGARIESSQGI